MAKNWTVAEAYEALRNGDKEARMDVGRRFPLFATATEDEIIAAIPDYISVRKVEAVLKADVDESEAEVEAEEVEEAKPAKKAKAKKVAEPEEEDDDFDDEDEEEEAPKKPVKKAAKAKKPAKKVVEDDDEDDDMDDF